MTLPVSILTASVSVGVRELTLISEVSFLLCANDGHSEISEALFIITVDICGGPE